VRSSARRSHRERVRGTSNTAAHRARRAPGRPTSARRPTTTSPGPRLARTLVAGNAAWLGCRLAREQTDQGGLRSSRQGLRAPMCPPGHLAVVGGGQPPRRPRPRRRQGPRGSPSTHRRAHRMPAPESQRPPSP
jgi:hypothetical protein